MHIAEITKVTTRRYRDNGQIMAYVEWTDCAGRTGRTEGDHNNQHMIQLIARGIREGILPVQEEW